MQKIPEVRNGEWVSVIRDVQGAAAPAPAAGWMGVLIKRDPRGNPRGANFEQPYLGRVVVTRAKN